MNNIGIAMCTACLVLLGLAPAVADDYAGARAELIEAYQAGDFAAMVAAADKALRARPAYPGALFNRALAHALNDDAEAALADLMLLLEKGIDFGVGQLDEFARVRDLPGWPRYEEGIRRLQTPVGEARIVATLDDGHFIPEGIAVDDAGSLYLGSIRRGQLLRVDQEPSVLSERQGHWSVFGMRLDGAGGLWFASAAVPQLLDVGADVGKTGLFRIDLETGSMTHAAVLPQRAEAQVLGDLVIDGEVIYSTDSLTGAVYRYDIATDTFFALVEPGALHSPQGLVIGESGEFLIVADYTGGLHRVALPGGDVERVVVDAGIPDQGIDGLYRYGNRLVAIQNGIRPHRVVSFELSTDGRELGDYRLLARNLPEFDEPTLGALRGEDLVFVANSHWNRFDRENRLPESLSGPIILKIGLGKQK